MVHVLYPCFFLQKTECKRHIQQSYQEKQSIDTHKGNVLPLHTFTIDKKNILLGMFLSYFFNGMKQ